MNKSCRLREAAVAAVEATSFRFVFLSFLFFPFAAGDKQYFPVLCFAARGSYNGQFSQD